MNSIVRGVTPAPELESQEFRRAMRTLAGGVAILTSGFGEYIAGMTVTSLTSLSAEPPRVMVGVNRSASVYPLVARLGVFAVSILASDQEEIAVRFSTKGVTGAARFDGLPHRVLVSGAPTLTTASAVLDCQVEEIIERHSHAIVIGRVLETAVRDGRGGLAYRDSRFVSLAPETTLDENLARWAVW